MLLNICSDPKNRDIKDVLYTLHKNVGGSMESIMEEQFRYNLKVDEFARLCGRSLSTFKREFRKTYDTTPQKWLLAKRLNLARNIILNTDLTIQEVCYDCGFESDSHFVRSFKNQFGVTPNQWRLSKANAMN